jgi:hypothetical protein
MSRGAFKSAEIRAKKHTLCAASESQLPVRGVTFRTSLAAPPEAWFHPRSRRDAMYQTTQSVYPVVQSIFGPGYVAECHTDQAHPSLLPADREFYFAAILKSLRSALRIQQSQ